MTPLSEHIDLVLAQHASELDFESLSENTIERTVTFIADTMSVGMAGSSVPEASLLTEALTQPASLDVTPVWGRRTSLPTCDAILLNAFQIHCQEYDCLHEGAVLHAMATLLPVLMAQCQHGAPVSGRELIAAAVAGIDIACTLGLSSQRGLQFFRPATAGGFGAVAGLSRLRGYSPEQTLAAFGFQLAQASGTMQSHIEGSPVLPLQAGFNARAAWQSCDLVKSGLTSLCHPLTGPFGFLPMFEQDFSVTPLLATLGQPHRIDEFSHKPYPAGRATHGGIEGLSRLMHEHQLHVDDIESVRISGPVLINRLVNRPPKQNPTANYARLCMPFVLAKVMQHGELRPEHYSAQALCDPKTYELSQKVQMQQNHITDPNALMPQSVSVHLTNGQAFTVELTDALASATRPLTPTQCQTKFMQCCALAKQPVAEPDKLFKTLRELPELDDVFQKLASWL